MIELHLAFRDALRALRPIEVVVLLDVALDLDDPRAQAPTSARLVAQHLAITPGAAARSLTELCRRGILARAQEVGEAGRFGLAVYRLSSDVAGLRPCSAPPHTVGQEAEPPSTVAPLTTQHRDSGSGGAVSLVDQEALELGW